MYCEFAQTRQLEINEMLDLAVGIRLTDFKFVSQYYLCHLGNVSNSKQGFNED